MFFADPVAAFANVARALRPEGRFVFTCWADLPGNEWITVPGAAAAEHVDLPPLGDPPSLVRSPSPTGTGSSRSCARRGW